MWRILERILPLDCITHNKETRLFCIRVYKKKLRINSFPIERKRIGKKQWNDTHKQWITHMWTLKQKIREKKQIVNLSEFWIMSLASVILPVSSDWRGKKLRLQFFFWTRSNPRKETINTITYTVLVLCLNVPLFCVCVGETPNICPKLLRICRTKTEERDEHNLKGTAKNTSFINRSIWIDFSYWLAFFFKLHVIWRRTQCEK